jgi:hypothetical protein
MLISGLINNNRMEKEVNIPKQMKNNIIILVIK